MVFNTSKSELQDLTGDDDKINLNKLVRSAKFRLIGLNSSFIRKLNKKILEEFNLIERTGEKLNLNNQSCKNYQTINQQQDLENEMRSDSLDESNQKKNKKFKLRPKKHLIRLFRRLNFRSNGLYEELKSIKDDEKIKKNKNRKFIKKIKKLTIDVCANLSSSVEMFNGNYNLSDQYGYNYDFNDDRTIYYNGCDYKVSGGYNYSTAAIYGPRYI